MQANLRQQLAELLGEAITSVRPVSGGDINQSFRVESTSASYFCKVNNALKFPLILEFEAKSLRILEEKTAFRIPKVIASGLAENEQFLLLEWAEPHSPNAPWSAFAENLAAMHQITHAVFGLDFDNFIGSLPQENTPSENWVEFFISRRLEAQLRLGGVPKDYFAKFSALFSRLEELLFPEAPALLHGDLWSGNVLHFGESYTVIDPAIYYGHREADLAMTALFGGFPSEFYSAYNAKFPLEHGWQDRLRIYQLYPLLVHVNLFGEGYLAGINQTLKAFA